MRKVEICEPVTTQGNLVTQEFLMHACGEEALAENTFYLLEQRLDPSVAGKSEDRLCDVAAASPSVHEQDVIRSLAVVTLVRVEAPVLQQQEFIARIKNLLDSFGPVRLDDIDARRRHRQQSALRNKQRAVAHSGTVALHLVG